MNFNYLPLIPIAISSTMTNAATPEEGKYKRPHILFCIADDAGHMSAYGTTWVNTPAFDRVAHEGLLFEQAYTCNSKSAPSRAAIITGRNSWQLKEACNHWPTFPSEFKSYPEALADNGYYVGCTGKGWSPGFANDANGNKRNMTGKPWNKRKLTPPTKQISNVDYSANFKDFLDSWDKKEPFCFWYGSLEPHRGYEFESSKRFGKATNQIDSVPSFWPDNEIVRRDMLDYAVEVEYFDRHLGRILQILEDAGELDNTIVIVTSDHGIPFPRCKGQEYYHSNHIPMAMMWKNGIQQPGRKIDECISVIDLAPTLLEAAGISQKQSGMQAITGRSFVDILRNENTGIDRNFVMIGKERHDVGRPNDEGYPIRGMIRGDFLYLKNYETNRWPAGNPETGYMNVDASPTKTEILKARRNPQTAYLWELSFGKRNEEELYNIKKDPNCMNNLVGKEEYQKIKIQMEKEMITRLLDEGDPRTYGKGYIFDRYPNTSGARQYWNRTKAGEKVSHGWINETDIEPAASGLDVSGNGYK